mmetsp:Transcript_29006/g.66646  ORF Transcript_29006/g.66646 Transcript_29006/m.66646 type:complete len:539 (-) Transcript_29006:102-1718(-)
MVADEQGKGDAWWTLVSCMLLMLIAGTIYAFSEFSAVFKDTQGYHLDQTQVSLLALFASLGNYFVLDGGLVISRLGPVTALVCGVAFASSGYLALWISVVQFSGELHFGLLVFFCWVYGHGCGYIDSAVMTQLLQDFPGYRGNIVGCVKAFYGLATAIFAVAYEAVFAPTRSAFLCFIGLYSLIMGIIFIPVVKKSKAHVHGPRSRILRKFDMLTIGLVVAAIFVLAVSIAGPSIEKMEHKAIIWVPVLVTMFAGVCSLFLLTRPSNFPPDGSVTAQTVGNRDSDFEPSEGSDRATEAPPPVDMTGWSTLLKADFWLLLFVLIVSQGSGLLILHEAAQIMPAVLGKDTESVTGFVAMISCFNSLGRLSFGNGSELLLAQGVPRTVFLIASTVLLALVHLILAVSSSGLVLWVGGAVAGFAYGGLWGVQPVIVMELFGPTDYGFKYTCSAMAAGIGFLIFGTALAGTLYDAKAVARGESPNCYSSECFSTAFVVTFLSALPAVFAGIVLWRRTASVYDEIRCARLQAAQSLVYGATLSS